MAFLLGFLENRVRLIATLLWTGGMSLVITITSLIQDEWGVRNLKRWGRGVCALMKIRLQVESEAPIPERGGLIYAPNHESWFDAPVLTALPGGFRWVAKRELRYVPFLRLGLRATGTFFLRRKKSSSDISVMKDVEDGLVAGERVLIFPEGTRTRDGSLCEFRRGAFRTAQNTGVPIYPIGIQGTYAIAPAGKLPHHTGFDVRVRVGKPFFIAPEEDISAAIFRFREEVYRLSRSGDAAAKPL